MTPDAMKLAVSGSNPAWVKSNGAVDESKTGEKRVSKRVSGILTL